MTKKDCLVTFNDNNGNIFENPNPSADMEIFTEILNKPGLKIERIVSSGQSSPENFWYEQDENEWVIVLKGEAELEFSDKEFVKMKTGDYIFLPRRKKHRVNSTSNETVWLAIFFK